jgi:AAA15 family ATPase/GTPase
MIHITSIHFKNYKSFEHYTVSLSEFNILVGPNNSGKSTIIGSLKILSEGIRKARNKKPILIHDPNGTQVFGYQIDLAQIPVATENVFHNYDDSSPAIVKFYLSNKSVLQIFFPEQGVCFLYCECQNKIIRSPKDFKDTINIEIGFVPILGPVEHREPLYQIEAARLALLTHRAARNFRNIWHHYNEDFNDFKELVISTWPGMDIDEPEVDYSGERPIISMFCPEERIPRELFWAGFGFQVWCQMLTFIIKNRNSTIFIIDEPDIYLHSDLQRQLLGILKGLGPDIIIATHSTEMISEADLNDILVINKSSKSAKRIKDPSELQKIFQTLGSNLNPILTQIAKSKRVLFVEGKDFIIFSKLARLLNLDQVANRSDFAVIPLEGFNPQKLRAFKAGIEKTIGTKVLSAVIFDRDYRSENEIKEDIQDLSKGNYFAHIHSRKELENYLIIPSSLESAIKKRITERNIRTNDNISFAEDINQLLNKISEEFKNRTFAQLQSKRIQFEKRKNPSINDSTITEKLFSEFESSWENPSTKLMLVPGKDFISSLNDYLQTNYHITISFSNIIAEMSRADISDEIKNLLKKISEFRKTKVENEYEA